MSNKAIHEVFSLVANIAFQDKYAELEDASKQLTPIEKIAFAALDYVCGMEGFVCQPQVQIGKYRVDFLVHDCNNEVRIIIECDGHDFHEKTKEQAHRDKKRDRDLQAAGYKVFRFTGSEIWKTRGRVVAESIKNDCGDYWEACGIPAD